MDGIPVDGPEKMTHNLPTSPNLPSCEKQFVQELNCGVEVPNPGQGENGRLIGPQERNIGEFKFETHASSEVSLHQVLSDTISGILMEDAMVMPCGHSFGISGLHRVKETNLCLTCGAPVPAKSMIPNYALRAAVIAYKREGTRRKRDLRMQAESDGKRLNRALADPEVSRPRGVQFPYVTNDRVLIKGNKRTPERFVGREAIITTQCLNGWYLVKTLDNGECVRLQYRSLLKLADEGTTEASHEKVPHGTRNGDDSKRPLLSTRSNILCADNEEGFPPSSVDRIEGNSFFSGAAKVPCSESLSRSYQISHLRKRGNHIQVADASGASWHSGRTSSNSSQELQGDQVHGKRAQEAVAMYDSADEDQRAVKRVAAIGATGCLIEGSTRQSKCSIRRHNATHLKAWGGETGLVEAGLGGEILPDKSFLGSKNQGKRTRPKHISAQFHKGLSTKSDLQEADPYKKVYVSGLHRRANNGDSPALMARKQSAFASLDSEFDHYSALPHQEPDVKTSGESNNCLSAASFCESLKKRLLELETELPWSCMQTTWKKDRVVWLDILQMSSTLKDVAKRLEELRRALILDKAGNMSDDEWNSELEAAVEQEAVEAVEYLWKRLHDDISKLMVSKFKRDRKPLSSIKIEFLELKNRFPRLCIGGLSHVGVIAATSIAAAEAYAVGEEDIETLLTIPMKLVQEHNIQDLREVIYAIESEKRHLAAKVLSLGSGSSNHGNSNVDDVLIETSKQVPASPTFLEPPSIGEVAKEPILRTNDGRHKVYDKQPVLDADSQEKDVAPMEETGGEETELSDSD